MVSRQKEKFKSKRKDKNIFVHALALNNDNRGPVRHESEGPLRIIVSFQQCGNVVIICPVNVHRELLFAKKKSV